MPIQVWCNDIKLHLLEQVQKSSKAEKIDAYIAYLDILYKTNDDASLEYAKELSSLAEELNSLKGLAYAFEYEGLYYGKIGELERALKVLEKSEQYFSQIPNREKHLARVLSHMSLVAGRRGFFDKKRQLAEKALALAKKSNDHAALGIAYKMLAQVEREASNGEKTLPYLEKSIYHYKLSDNKGEGAATMISYGYYWLTRDVKKAAQVFDDAIVLCKEYHNDRVLLFALMGMTDVCKKVGDYDRGLNVAFRRYKLAKEFNHKIQIVLTAEDLGHIYHKFKDYEKAREYFMESLNKAEEFNFQWGKIEVLGTLGELERELGNFDAAIECQLESVCLAKEVSLMDRAIEALSFLGKSYMESGQFEKAYDSYQEILTLCKDRHTHMVYEAYAGIGQYFLEKNQFNKAIFYASKALDKAEDFRNFAVELQATQILAAGYENNGNYKKALTFEREANVLQDSIDNFENAVEKTRLDMNTQFEKQHLLDSLAFVQIQKSKDLEITRHKNRQKAFLAFGLLMLLGAGTFLYQLFQTQKARRKSEALLDEVKQLNQTKDRLFSIIGHDLRKPAIAFRGITKKVNYLLKKEDYKTLNALGSEIERDALALNKLTDNLLNWALTQKEMMPYNPTIVKLSEISNELETVYGKIANDKNIQFQNHIQNGLEVYADSNALNTILRNLTDNALKFTPSGGIVILDAATTSECVKIQISDNGVGISKEKLKTIFELQKDKSQAGTSDEKGTGLGLHLVQELVELNKGNIEVSSTPGKGTVFVLNFPKMGPD